MGSLTGMMRAMSSVLLSRAQIVGAQAGITFGGKRDTFEVLGYARTLGPMDYWSRFRRGGIARRVVVALPKATWRGGGELVEDQDPNVVTEFEEQFFLLAERLHLWSRFLRADILAGLGQYSVMLVGFPGELNEPITAGSVGQIGYMQTFSESDVTIKEYELDAQNPRFGQPVIYSIKRLDAKNPHIGKPVHWTRLIHVADGLLDNEVTAPPRLEAIWNYLDDLDKVVGGGSEAFWLRANQGMQIDVDPELELETEDEDKLKDEADEYANGVRRIMRTRGVKVTTLGSDVADFSPQASSIINLIAGTVEIPQRILTGSERGELASTQDRSNWHDRVSDRRSEYAEPYIVRMLVDRCIEYGYLPTPTEYEVRWPQIQYLTDIERADVADKWAGVNQKYAGELVILPNEIRDLLLDLPSLDEAAEDYDPVIQDPLGRADQPRAAALYRENTALRVAKKDRWRKITRPRIAMLRKRNGKLSTESPTITAAASSQPSAAASAQMSAPRY